MVRTLMGFEIGVCKIRAVTHEHGWFFLETAHWYFGGKVANIPCDRHPTFQEWQGAEDRADDHTGRMSRCCRRLGDFDTGGMLWASTHFVIARPLLWMSRKAVEHIRREGGV